MHVIARSSSFCSFWLLFSITFFFFLYDFPYWWACLFYKSLSQGYCSAPLFPALQLSSPCPLSNWSVYFLCFLPTHLIFFLQACFILFSHFSSFSYILYFDLGFKSSFLTLSSDVLKILTLLSIFKYLFRHMTSPRQAEIRDAFIACASTFRCGCQRS